MSRSIYSTINNSFPFGFFFQIWTIVAHMSRACMEELVRIQHLISIVARAPTACRAFVVKLLSIRAPRNRVKMAARAPWRYHFNFDFIWLFITRSSIVITAAVRFCFYHNFCFSSHSYYGRGVAFRLKRHLQNWRRLPFAPHFEIKRRKNNNNNRVSVFNAEQNAFHAF